jgi:hypothetical protein
MESLRKLIALAGFIACVTVSVTAQDFNKQLRKAILQNGYVPVIPAITGPAPGQLATYCGHGVTRFEPNPNGDLPADKLKSVSMTSADVQLTQNLAFQAFLDDVTKALAAGSVAASTSVARTMTLKQISADGQSLNIIPNELAADVKIINEYNKQKQVGCRLLIVQSVYTTKSLDIEVDTTVNVAGGVTIGGSTVKNCTDPGSGKGVSVAVCVKDATHLTLTMDKPMVFATSLVEMKGPGLTKAVKAKDISIFNQVDGTQEIQKPL